jgi:hypothetical protein
MRGYAGEGVWCGSGASPERECGAGEGLRRSGSVERERGFAGAGVLSESGGFVYSFDFIP